MNTQSLVHHTVEYYSALVPDQEEVREPPEFMFPGLRLGGKGNGLASPKSGNPATGGICILPTSAPSYPSGPGIPVFLWEIVPPAFSVQVPGPHGQLSPIDQNIFLPLATVTGSEIDM